MATALVPVSALKEGDLIDLERDKFADNGEHPEFEFELQEVLGWELETPLCIRVDFGGGSFGFPPDHLVARATD